MEYGIAQGEVRVPDTKHPEVHSLGATMATAAMRSIGTKIGASLAVQGQRIIRNLRQPRS
jgi:hypothetical protein